MKNKIASTTRTNALRMHERGFGVRDICGMTGLSRAQLDEVLGRTPAPKGKAPTERERAIAELRSEGFSEAAIAAVFGR